MSPTTPTTVTVGAVGGAATRICWPTGSLSKSAATRLLTRATPGEPVSRSENPRPLRSGTPSVFRKSGVTYRMMAMLEPSAGTRRPSTTIGPAPMRVVYGRNVVKPADTTPGRPRTRSITSRRNACSRSGVG
jgi:hypothetical protein